VAVLSRLVYYGLVIPISRLPFAILYGLSDVLAFLLYYVVGYRKKVVMNNLRNSFPDKPEKERVAIARKFYRHFTDLTLESLKAFTISEQEALTRMTYSGREIPDAYYKQGRSLIIAMAHYNNWEMTAVTVAAALKHEAVAIYKPLSNKYFDEKMLSSRQRYGLRMMHNRTVKEDFQKQSDHLTATFFLVDQSPSIHSRPYWLTFLNQKTAVLTGAEKYAKEYDYPVVYLHVKKLKRGYYNCHFSNVSDQPGTEPEGAILEKVTRLLEKDIREIPEFWLWSHKRWKYKPDGTRVQSAER
jgi:KDO2-lipid IV(A) lauroyltransferase